MDHVNISNVFQATIHPHSPNSIHPLLYLPEDLVGESTLIDGVVSIDPRLLGEASVDPTLLCPGTTPPFMVGVSTDGPSFLGEDDPGF